MLFLASGGSALSLLEPEILPENLASLTISVLDEHYTTDASERNFCKMQKLPFYAAAKEHGAVFFDPYGGPVEEAGKRFDRFLKDWIMENPEGKLVATIGIGADGHTAGIVPFADSALFAKLFEDEEVLAVGYSTAYGDFPERVTSTLALLKKLHTAVLFVVGEEKAATLTTFLDTEPAPSIFPAQLLKRIPNLTVVTDRSLSFPTSP